MVWLLNELRNHSIHRAMLSKHVSVNIYENMNTNTSGSSKPMVYFLIDKPNGKREHMDKQVLEYLQESLESMKDLIEQIRKKDSLLV